MMAVDLSDDDRRVLEAALLKISENLKLPDTPADPVPLTPTRVETLK